jgi:hypothetical protein
MLATEEAKAVGEAEYHAWREHLKIPIKNRRLKSGNVNVIHMKQKQENTQTSSCKLWAFGNFFSRLL